jgi:hypothetical protein
MEAETSAPKRKVYSMLKETKNFYLPKISATHLGSILGFNKIKAKEQGSNENNLMNSF